MQAKIEMYQADQKKAFSELREVRLENIKLTLMMDEMKERNRFLERKYLSLVERCGASKEDLEAVEVMVAAGPKAEKGKPKYNKELAQQRDKQREQNPSRLDKIDDEIQIREGREIINSYDYYGNKYRGDYASSH